MCIISSQDIVKTNRLRPAINMYSIHFFIYNYWFLFVIAACDSSK